MIRPQQSKLTEFKVSSVFCNTVHNFSLSLILLDEREASQQKGAAKETLHMWRADKNQQAAAAAAAVT